MIFVFECSYINIIVLQTFKIAEYNDDQWTEYGSLSTGRYAHDSITHDYQTMIIGAYSSS